MIKPLNLNILVKPIKEEERTKSGLYVPKENKTKGDEGIVMAIGSLVEGLKEGDRIVFMQYSPNEVVIEGETYFFMTENDVLGVFPNEKK